MESATEKYTAAVIRDYLVQKTAVRVKRWGKSLPVKK